MPKTRLISPGSIPNHKLLKNLQLQGNYISNDGGNEGITINNDGDVLINGTNKLHFYDDGGGEYIESSGTKLDITGQNIDLNMSLGSLDLTRPGISVPIGYNFFIDNTGNVATFYSPADSNDKMQILVATDGATKISTVNNEGSYLNTKADLEFELSGDLIVDRNYTGILTHTQKGIAIDFDATGNTLADNTATNIGLDIDLDSSAQTNSGTVNDTGIKLAVIGGADGTSTATGINVAISGDADTNTGATIVATGGTANQGLNITVPDASDDYHIKLMAADDVDDYALIKVADTGDLTIETVGDGTNDSEMNLVCDGGLTIDTKSHIDLKAQHVSASTYMTINVGTQPGLTTNFPLTLQSGSNDDLTIDARGTGDIIMDSGGATKFETSAVFSTVTNQTITTGTITVDWNTSNKQSIDITGTGYTVAFTNPAGACNLILKVIQGDGDDTITTWDGDIRWAGGVAPTLSTGNAQIDIISFYWDGAKYYGVASLDFS